MRLPVTLREARPSADAGEIAAIHLAARRETMPYLHRPHTDDETRDYFARVVGDRPGTWWVAHHEGRMVGYMFIDGERLEHLYVRPDSQRQGVGAALLDRAKALSPGRLELWTFQRNTGARAFYASRGFRVIEYTAGQNEEHEPDVRYAWVGEQ